MWCWLSHMQRVNSVVCIVRRPDLIVTWNVEAVTFQSFKVEKMRFLGSKNIVPVSKWPFRIVTQPANCEGWEGSTYGLWIEFLNFSSIDVGKSQKKQWRGATTTCIWMETATSTFKAFCCIAVHVPTKFLRGKVVPVRLATATWAHSSFTKEHSLLNILLSYYRTSLIASIYTNIIVIINHPYHGGKSCVCRNGWYHPRQEFESLQNHNNEWPATRGGG